MSSYLYVNNSGVAVPAVKSNLSSRILPKVMKRVCTSVSSAYHGWLEQFKRLASHLALAVSDREYFRHEIVSFSKHNAEAFGVQEFL
jgi:hypothetical protein